LCDWRDDWIRIWGFFDSLFSMVCNLIVLFFRQKSVS
jgi:hypothetical protein